MSVMEPYDITNNEQLRRIEVHLSEQDQRIAIIEGRTTAVETAVNRLDMTVTLLDATVERFAGFVHALTTALGWVKRGRIKLLAVLGVVGLPILSNIISAIFHHLGWA
jgi:hypothetical protein